MPEQVAAVEPKPNNSTPERPGDSMPDLPPSAERAAAKFVYASGSQPLAGYTIKRGVGHGGFGEIYYATSDAGKEVALKLVRRNLDIELRGIQHCLNLKHPNLLSLFDIRQDDRGDTWVVMEYISGGHMEDAIVAHPNGMPADEALAWFHGIAAGVAYLHDRGIVHRDLKPGNIFADEGVVKVGDYGLSKFISCSRRSGQTESVGTVHYMAPEVANGRYGKEIDIYALGIILYEMLTGRVPFEGQSVGEVLMKHLTARPDLAALAEPYRSVVARALEKDPQRRFRSVPEMIAALPAPAQVPPGAARLPSGAAVGLGVSGGASGGLPPLSGHAVKAQVVDEEPIYRALRDAAAKLRTAWTEANLATPVKVILLVFGLFVLLASWQVLIPLAIMALAFYGLYWVIRKSVVEHHGPVTAAVRPAVSPQTSPAAAAPGRYGPAYARTRRGRPPANRWHAERPAAIMVLRPPRERFAQLVGSLLIGAIVAVAMSVVMVLLFSYHNARPGPEQCAWLGLMSIAATWSVLVPSKFWEGTRGEVSSRRFIMMLIGLALGALAFALAATLMVELPYTRNFPEPSNYRFPAAFYSGGRPLAMAYMACFGTLFLVLRWWRQADPLRNSRLSVWSMIVSVAMAAVVASAWHFPQPWLPMVAGAVSVSVQLASPWVHPNKRLRPQNV